ncbi:hypothetical protein Tco_1033706 [Tanacetum coccineum]
MEGPLLMHDKDAESEILETDAAINDLIVQPKGKPGLLQSERHLGCIEDDEVNGVFFLFDTNHHRIIMFGSNEEILNYFALGTASEVFITSADSQIRVVDGANLVHKFKGGENSQDFSQMMDGHIVTDSDEVDDDD